MRSDTLHMCVLTGYGAELSRLDMSGQPCGYMQQPKGFFSTPSTTRCHRFLEFDPHAVVDDLDIIPARVALPADPVSVIRVLRHAQNSRERVALRPSQPCSLPVGEARRLLTLLSLILNDSGPNGLRLMIVAPSLRSRNMSVRSELRLAGKTSLFTSWTGVQPGSFAKETILGSDSRQRRLHAACWIQPHYP